MNIFISTVERPNKSPYLERCIESIRQDYDGEIHLIVGGEHHEYTDKYTVDQGFIRHILYPGEQFYENNKQKAALGYYTALIHDPTTPALIFEDDAVLEKDWYTKLQKLLTFIPDEKFILSLITPGKGTVPEPNSTVPSVQRYNYQAYLNYDAPGQLPTSTIVTYCNTTGVYYPPSMLKTRLNEFIKRFAVHGDAVYDIVLGQYMFRYDLPIYIAVPNLLKGVDTSDSSLGSEKRPATVDYSDWDYKKQ
ncbi:MAG: hypothetical protein C5B43_02335 [Verrucomicrobia bacterium]|nr:MAG: hypothetical protein C5B43_02335 [Verrucomicrobiota bacterium]